MFFNPLLTFHFKMFILTKAGIGALMPPHACVVIYNSYKTF